MPNTPDIMCKLDRVDIFSALNGIYNSLYDAFSAEQQRKLQDDIGCEYKHSHFFLLVLLEPSSIEVINEINVYMIGSEEQRYIKKLLNRKLPVILEISFFDDYKYPQGDICVVGYSRLLDRVGTMTISANLNQKRMLKHIKSRRKIWREVYKAVTLDEFIEALRKEQEN